MALWYTFVIKFVIKFAVKSTFTMAAIDCGHLVIDGMNMVDAIMFRNSAMIMATCIAPKPLYNFPDFAPFVPIFSRLQRDNCAQFDELIEYIECIHHVTIYRDDANVLCIIVNSIPAPPCYSLAPLQNCSSTKRTFMCNFEDEPRNDPNDYSLCQMMENVELTGEDVKDESTGEEPRAAKRGRARY